MAKRENEKKPYRFVPVSLPPVTVDDLLRLAANDRSVSDDTFAVLSRALRGVDPIKGES